MALGTPPVERKTGKYPGDMTEIEIRIEKLVFGGEGLGFLNGKAVFVEGALPEEKVQARILNEKPNYAKASLVRILESSPHRAIPPCPYLERCGGCQYQHLPYPEELRWKEKQVQESFQQSLQLDPALIQPIQHGPNEYGYRNSISLHRTTEKNNKPQRLGFIGKDNYSKILIHDCLLADKHLKEIFTAEHKLNRNEERRAFKLDDKNRIFTSDDERIYRTRVGSTLFWTSSLGFFQNNLPVTDLIGKKLGSWVASCKASRFIDLYSGVGTFSLLSASTLPEIFCFEESPHSIGCARRNFKECHVPHAGIFTGKVEKTFPRWILQNPKSGTLVFVDPPRTGIASSLAHLLGKGESAENIIYLSCDLQILLRDLKIILASNRYQIQTVVPFDMFPRTKHIEILVHLKK